MFINRVVRHSWSESGIDGVQICSQSNFIFVLSGAELLQSSLSVNFYLRRRLHPTGERASSILQVVMPTTKDFCVSKEPNLIHRMAEGLL